MSGTGERVVRLIGDWSNGHNAGEIGRITGR
jgi:hypothetical protein